MMGVTRRPPRRHPRAGRAALLLRRARLRGLLRRRLRRRRLGAAAAKRAPLSTSSPTAWKRSARSHREGPRHRRGDRRPHHGPRSRPRKDVLDEEGFRRQAAGAPARSHRSRPQAAGRAEIARRQAGAGRRAPGCRRGCERSRPFARARHRHVLQPGAGGLYRAGATGARTRSATARRSPPPIRCAARMARSRSSDPCFVDKDGSRMHG